jgi:hypothetical protein
MRSAAPSNAPLASMPLVGRLEHQALHHVHHDVAGEAIVVRPLAEGRLRRDGAGEIFVGDTLEPFGDQRLERRTGFDLMARDSDIHDFTSASI